MDPGQDQLIPTDDIAISPPFLNRMILIIYV